MGYSAIVQKEHQYSRSVIQSEFSSDHFPTAAIRVDGMVCINCSQIIESNLKKKKGVKHISVSVDEKCAQVSYDPALLSVDNICSAIEDLGFEATLPGDNPLMGLMLPALHEPPPSEYKQKSCVMTIDGMTCCSCVGLIESQLSGMKSVFSVQVSLEEKEGRITYDAAITSPKELVTVIEDLGYTVTHVDGMLII